MTDTKAEKSNAEIYLEELAVWRKMKENFEEQKAPESLQIMQEVFKPLQERYKISSEIFEQLTGEWQRNAAIPSFYDFVRKSPHSQAKKTFE